MLPANHGDCIWIEWGAKQNPRRLLIDGGPKYAWKALRSRFPQGDVSFELVVITHIDADHIGGLLQFVGSLPEGVRTKEIWFNAWQHVQPPDQLGAVQGEVLTAVIESRRIPWNDFFGGSAVVVPDPGEPPVKKLPVKELPDGLRLTLLSPTYQELAALRPKWEKEVRRAGLVPGVRGEALKRAAAREGIPPDLLGGGLPDPKTLANYAFGEDTSLANASSIVLLAEYEGKAILLTGDAYPSVVTRGVNRLLAERQKETLRLDALKVSHHGSHGNTNNDLLDLVHCPHFLISTNGRIFKHPHAETVGRLIVHGGSKPTLWFNYRSEQNKVWDDAGLRARFNYQTMYPPTGDGLSVPL